MIVYFVNPNIKQKKKKHLKKIIFQYKIQLSSFYKFVDTEVSDKHYFIFWGKNWSNEIAKKISQGSPIVQPTFQILQQYLDTENVSFL